MTNDQIAVNWFKHYQDAVNFGFDSAEAEKSFVGHECLQNLCIEDPIKALKIIKLIFEMSPADRIFYNLAAGPFEDLLVLHGLQLIPNLKKLVQENPDFLRLFEGVWIDGIAYPVRSKLMDLLDEYGE